MAPLLHHQRRGGGARGRGGTHRCAGAGRTGGGVGGSTDTAGRAQRRGSDRHRRGHSRCRGRGGGGARRLVLKAREVLLVRHEHQRRLGGGGDRRGRARGAAATVGATPSAWQSRGVAEALARRQGDSARTSASCRIAGELRGALREGAHGGGHLVRRAAGSDEVNGTHPRRQVVADGARLNTSDAGPRRPRPPSARRCVRGGEGGAAELGERRHGAVVGVQLGDAEVQDAHVRLVRAVAVLQEEVARLDVAVHQPTRCPAASPRAAWRRIDTPRPAAARPCG
jgi:hypothetical protein